MMTESIRYSMAFTGDMRNGDWMQTFTGKAFYPADPRVEDIDIIDIAHALSMECRYGGHCSHFYSVAEHCVLLCDICPDPFQRGLFLMHDAEEAYLKDIPRPLKASLRDYKPMSRLISQMIRIKFGVRPLLDTDLLHEYDYRICLDEAKVLLGKPPMPWANSEWVEPLGVGLSYWTPQIAKIQFLKRFNVLFPEHAV